VKRGIARHESFHAIDVVGVDGLFQLPNLLQRIDVCLELRPARKSVAASDLELRICDRRRGASLEQVPGLVFQVAEIGAVGKRT
jgi:hypothetical protein